MIYRQWNAVNPKAALLLVHGLGAHSARWEFLANYFQPRGISSYSLELRGFGKTTDQPRGHVDSFELYYQDILELRQLIAREIPGKPVFLLGESLGGLLAFVLAGRYFDKFAGLIMISPAFANGLKFPLSAYLTLIANLLNQKKQIPIHFTSEMCTRDPAYQKVMNANPDEIRVASVKLLLNIITAQFQAVKLAKRFKNPSLFLLAGKDYLVDERRGRKIFQALNFKDKTLIEYPDMLHALSIDLGREKVFADLLAWLEKRF